MTRSRARPSPWWRTCAAISRRRTRINSRSSATPRGQPASASTIYVSSVNVLLLHLDGKLPNLALMRLSAWHKAQGDAVEFRRVDNAQLIGPRLEDPARWDRVYGSLIFE